MRYFVTGVLTPHDASRIRKCALLQGVARKFEHCAFEGLNSVFILQNVIRRICYAANEAHGGRRVLVNYNAPGMTITAVMRGDDGEEELVFQIRMAREECTLSTDSLACIVDAVATAVEPK